MLKLNYGLLLLLFQRGDVGVFPLQQARSGAVY